MVDTNSDKYDLNNIHRKQQNNIHREYIMAKNKVVYLKNPSCLNISLYHEIQPLKLNL